VAGCMRRWRSSLSAPHPRPRSVWRWKLPWRCALPRLFSLSASTPPCWLILSCAGQLAQRIQAVVRELWGAATRVAVFGSQATTLGLPGSDIDLVVRRAPTSSPRQRERERERESVHPVARVSSPTDRSIARKRGRVASRLSAFGTVDSASPECSTNHHERLRCVARRCWVPWTTRRSATRTTARSTSRTARGRSGCWRSCAAHCAHAGSCAWRVSSPPSCPSSNASRRPPACRCERSLNACE
jgi:hypothetical protein